MDYLSLLIDTTIQHNCLHLALKAGGLPDIKI